jgi:hypothetical protein
LASIFGSASARRIKASREVSMRANACGPLRLKAEVRYAVSHAAYPAMMRRSMQRLGLRECRAACLLGLTVREYRALEAGAAPLISSDLWDRMVDVFEWPQASPANSSTSS